MDKNILQANDLRRNVGIDAFRLYAMFSVVALHTLGHGGILKNASGAGFAVSWFLETLFLAAVNCYGLISGFVGYRKKARNVQLSKYLELWLQVVLYSVGLTVIIQVVTGNFDVKELLKACLPVTSSRYWYFTAYTAVYFAMPWINRLIGVCSEGETRRLLLLLVAFVVYNSIANVVYDPIKLSGGYSFVWLAILYLTGACIKKLDIAAKVKKWQCVVCSVILLMFTWVTKLVTSDVNLLTTYTSVTIAGSAVALLLLFSKLNIERIGRCVVSAFAPCAFGVYLIHDHPLVREFLIIDSFEWIAKNPFYLIPLWVLLVSGCIFALCLLIDKLRQIFFSFADVHKVCARVESILKLSYEWILEKY